MTGTYLSSTSATITSLSAPAVSFGTMAGTYLSSTSATVTSVLAAGTVSAALHSGVNASLTGTLSGTYLSATSATISSLAVTTQLNPSVIRFNNNNSSSLTNYIFGTLAIGASSVAKTVSVVLPYTLPTALYKMHATTLKTSGTLSEIVICAVSSLTTTTALVYLSANAAGWNDTGVVLHWSVRY
jgi:hypothetical protein